MDDSGANSQFIFDAIVGLTRNLYRASKNDHTFGRFVRSLNDLLDRPDDDRPELVEVRESRLPCVEPRRLVRGH